LKMVDGRGEIAIWGAHASPRVGEAVSGSRTFLV